MANEPSYDYSKNAQLIKAAQSGDKAAMEELITGNMGLVRSIVPRFADRGVEYEDLIQIGTIGMIKAVKSYSAEFNTVFSTYAVPLIIGEIRRFLRDDGIIKVGRVTKRAAQNATSTWGQRAEGYGATLVPVTGDAETFELILTGRADFSINAETAFTHYLKEHPEAAVRVAFRTDTAITQSVVPAHKGSEKFIAAVNKAIDELRADGTLAAISVKYFGADFSSPAK